MNKKTCVKVVDDDCFFPFGSMYAPVARATEIPMSEWERDIAQMKEMGFTIIRSWAAWDRIETEEGKYDFSKIDYIFELCEQYEMKIILFIGGAFRSLVGCYAPFWARGGYQIQTEEGAGSYLLSAVCFDDPSFKRKAGEFLEVLIKRYARRSALHSWIIWGEPAWKGCRCEHTLKKFRNWLKVKYDDVPKLNTAWSGEAPVRFRRWEDVEPIELGYAPKLDWKEFLEWNLNDAIVWHSALLKKHSHKPAMAYPCPWEMDARATENNSDFWLTGRTIDIMGMSHYIFQYPHNGTKGYVTACYLDRVRSAASNGDFWVTENQAGPFLWNFKAPHEIKPELNTLLNAQMLAHGAKGILSWMYRSRISDSQAGEFGLAAWDGSITERGRAISEFARFVKRKARLFAKTIYKSEIAILTSHSTMRLTAVEGCWNERGDDYWQESWLGAYKLMWDLNLQTDFIDDKGVLEGKLEKYKVLLIPFRLNMEDDTAAKIAKFVADGGMAVADFPLAMKNDNGLMHKTIPGCGLEKIFACVCNDAGLVRGERIEGEGVSIPSSSFKYAMRPLNNGRITAKYSASDESAIVSNRYGKGRTILAGTLFFRQYELESNAGTKNLMRNWLDDSDIHHNLEVKSVKDPKKGLENLEIRKLNIKDDDDSVVFFVLNHSTVKLNLACAIGGKSPHPNCEITDLRLATAVESNNGEFRLKLGAMDFAVILAKAQNEHGER